MLVDLEEQLGLDDVFGETLSYVRAAIGRMIDSMAFRSCLAIQPKVYEIIAHAGAAKKQRGSGEERAAHTQALLDDIFEHLDDQLGVMNGVLFDHLFQKYLQRLHTSFVCICQALLMPQSHHLSATAVAAAAAAAAKQNKNKDNDAAATVAILEKASAVKGFFNSLLDGLFSGDEATVGNEAQVSVVEDLLPPVHDFLHADGRGLKKSFFQKNAAYKELMELVMTFQTDSTSLIRTYYQTRAAIAKAKKGTSRSADSELADNLKLNDWSRRILHSRVKSDEEAKQFFKDIQSTANV